MHHKKGGKGGRPLGLLPCVRRYLRALHVVSNTLLVGLEALTLWVLRPYLCSTPCCNLSKLLVDLLYILRSPRYVLVSEDQTLVVTFRAAITLFA